jgi:hypothetical protein
METSRHDSGERIELMLQKQLKERLDQFKAEVAQRPFFCVTIAFLAGLFSWTFPVRLVLTALLPTALSPFRTGDSADGYAEDQRTVF